MRLFFAFLFICWITSVTAQLSAPPIGSWREHLPYNSAIDVTTGAGKIYCATPYSLFSISSADGSIERMSRVTGLHETGISTIHYDNANEKLLIAYSNSNIDIIYRQDIFNIPDIKRDNIVGDKNIYSIYSLGKNYYLSAGLGVIVIDGEKYEVKDSWLIGNGSNQVKVNGFTSDGGFYYAATEEGLKKTPIGNPNPANYSSWQLQNNGLAIAPCKNVWNVHDKIVAQQHDSLFVQNGSSWQLLYGDGWPVINSSVSAGKILLSERLNGVGRIVVLNADGTIYRVLAQTAPVSFPRKAILTNNEIWVADQFGGLSRHGASGFEQFKPNSPESVGSGELTVYNDALYATAGEVNSAWNYQYNGNGIFAFTQGEWNNINRFRYPVIDSLLDYITIAIDPKDETIWTGSYGGGLLHIKQGPSFEIFKQQVIGAAIGDPGSYRVAGLAFDRENNLWVSNYGASQPLKVRKSSGAWAGFSPPFLLNENALAQLLVDDHNYKWIVSPKGNGLICYDQGISIDNTGDDRWKLYRSDAGNGNLPSNDVLCVAKDKNGYIWTGTSDGIAVIQCASDVFTAPGCDAIWPVVQQGSFASYLFKGEEVRAIAVDGANRKWIATRSGAWLINASGEKILYQFTETNSPLLSSDVKKIAIDGKTGEVYFATAKGTCSFRGTATDGNEFNSSVLVFPNPVPPGYTGSIGIRGVVENAIVKITELNGRLVYQTKALGGQAVWDGKDYRGQKIASGVYLVLVSNDDKTVRTAAKIVFINK